MQGLRARLIKEAAEGGIQGKHVSWLKQRPTQERVDREKSCCATTSLEGKWRGATDARADPDQARGTKKGV